MKKIKMLVCILLLSLLPIQGLAITLNSNNIDQVVASMSLNDKVRFLVGAAGMGGDNVFYGAAATTYRLDSMGIPRTTFIDGPIGVARFKTATAMPGLNVMASTFNTDLIYRAARVLGDETAKMGVDCLLGPGVETQRNPLGGRNADYFSEDSVVSGLMGAAYVNGLQSKDVQASVKHFVGNVAETLRERNDSVMSERTLRETYLRNFEITVKRSNPGNMMTSYNLVNNVFATEFKDLLIDIPRNEWGYDGIFITDWYAGNVDPAYPYSTVGMIEGGSHIMMPGSILGSPNDRRTILYNWANGNPQRMAIIDARVRDILRYIVKTPTFKGTANQGSIDYEANAKVAREVAEEGIVLLKNENALPIQKTDTVALFGEKHKDTLITGGGSAAINADTRYRSISIRDGFANAGIALNSMVSSLYNGAGEPNITEAQAAEAAKTSDVAFYVVMKTSAEWGDRKPTREDMGYYIREVQLNNIKRISAAFRKEGKKLIVLINSTGPIDVAEWRDYADGIVYMSVLGNETGTALVSVLTGAVTPSGKLAQIFPENYTDIPGAEEFPGELSPSGFYYDTTRDFRTLHMNEGIYVGYKYNTTYDVPTAYPFGFGLSYTTFDYSNMEINGNTARQTKISPMAYTGGDITVSVDVTNTGSVQGKESVQVYIHAVGTDLEVPEIELKQFAKTRTLKPGETQTLTMTLDTELMKYYNTSTASWVIPAGQYDVYVARSSEDMVENARFVVENEILVQKVSNKGETAHSKTQLDEIKKAEDGGLFDIVGVNAVYQYDGTSGTAPFGAVVQDGIFAPVTAVSGTKTFTTTAQLPENVRRLKIVGETAPGTIIYINGEKIAENESLPLYVDAPNTDTLELKVVSSGFGLIVKGIVGLPGNEEDMQAAIRQGNEAMKGDYSTKSKSDLRNAIVSAELLLLEGSPIKADADAAVKAIFDAINNLKATSAPRDAYQNIAAATFDEASSAIQIEADRYAIGYVVTGSYAAYYDVDFGEVGADSVTISYSCPTGRINPAVRVYLDSPTMGEPIATVWCRSEGDSWSNFVQSTAALSHPVRGKHHIYLHFEEDNSQSVVNLQYIRFTAAEAGSVSYMQSKIDALRAKRDENQGNAQYFAYLNQVVTEVTTCITRGTVTKTEEAALNEKIDCVLSVKDKLAFGVSVCEENSFHAYREGSIAKLTQVLPLAKEVLADQNASKEKIDQITALLWDTMEEAEADNAYAYREILAASGETTEDIVVDNEGFIMASDVMTKLDYGVLSFGDAGADMMTIRYKNTDVSDVVLYLYADGYNDLIAKVQIPISDENGSEKTVGLLKTITGTHRIYAKMTGKGQAGVYSIRFHERENDNSLQQLLSKDFSASEYNDVLVSLYEETKHQVHQVIAGSGDNTSSALNDSLEKIMQYRADEVTENLNPYQSFRSTMYTDAYNLRPVLEGNKWHLGGIKNNSWVKYSNIDFGEKGAVAMSFEVAVPGNDTSFVEVKLGGETGEILGIVRLPNTGGWSSYQRFTFYFEGRPIVGRADIWIHFMSSSGGDFCNVGDISFTEASAVYAPTLTAGESPYELFNAAEKATSLSGLGKITEVDANGNSYLHLGAIKNNSSVTFANRAFGEKGATLMMLEAACTVPGTTVDVLADGIVVATIALPVTSGWGDYTKCYAQFNRPITGTKELTLRFINNGYGADMCNVYRMSFTESKVPYVDLKAYTDAQKTKAFVESYAVTSLYQAPLVAFSAQILSELSTAQIALLGADYTALMEKQGADEAKISDYKKEAVKNLRPVIFRDGAYALDTQAGVYSTRLEGLYEDKEQFCDMELTATPIFAFYQDNRLVRVACQDEVAATDADTVAVYMWESAENMIPITMPGTTE